MIHEYRPNNKPQQSKPRSSWRSITTGILLPLNPDRLSDDISGYELKTLRQIIGDMTADLQKLRADRSALMQSMAANGADKAKVSAEVARIDLSRVPMARAWQVINTEIATRKDAPTWPALFVKVARKRLDPELMKSLSAETTKLREEWMNP